MVKGPEGRHHNVTIMFHGLLRHGVALGGEARTVHRTPAPTLPASGHHFFLLFFSVLALNPMEAAPILSEALYVSPLYVLLFFRPPLFFHPICCPCRYR